MGIIRKTTSVFTLGTIDYMSAKDRTARSARLTKKYTRKQLKATKKQG